MGVIGALAHFFTITQFFGLFPFVLIKTKNGSQFVECKKRLIKTKILFSFFTLLQIQIVWYCFYVNYPHMTTMSGVFLMFNSASTIIGSIMGVMIILLRGKTLLCEWLNKTNDIFFNLGETALSEIRGFYKRMLLLIFLCLISAFGSDMYLRYNGIINSERIWEEPIVFMVSYYILLWNTKLFLLLFLVFVNLLRYYYIETHQVLTTSANRHDERVWVMYIRNLRRKDLEIHDFLDFLHSFFIPVVSMQVYWGFSNFLFGVGLGSSLGVPKLTQLLWTVFIFWDLFIVVSICHDAEKQSEKTAHYLHRLLIRSDNKAIKNEVDLFSLQTLHRKLEFIAFGCHRINLTMIYSIIGSLSSYTVIILQFQQDPKDLNNSNHTEVD